MDQPEDELQQISKWLSEEGLSPDSPKEAQLCLLWRALQHTRGRLSRVTWDLDKQRSQHSAELTEVRKSLEQIRIFTEHKDVLAQEIQDENDQLKDQLRRLISLQDAQISEVAKMLYQQGLTELIHSSPSEQVAYLLVERASLLETGEVPDHLKGQGIREGVEVQAETQSTNTQQSPHKGAPRHHQNPWRRLFGLHKASQSKNTFILAEARRLAGQASSVQRECSRLERDLEEGSRRLAMAHSEIRRLTDELESSHLTQRAYEPELQAAQQEVEQLRQEVEKVKKYELVELRKTKELNDRLDLEIRSLRTRVRSLDAEKNSLQQTVVFLQREVGRLQSDLKEQQLTEQQLLTVKTQAAERALMNQTCRNLQKELDAQARCLMEKEETVISLQREVEQQQSALQEQKQQAEQKILTAQAQASQSNELVQSWATELIQSKEICKDLQNMLSAQSGCLLEKESEIQTLRQQLDDSHKENLIATISKRETNLEDSSLENQTEVETHHDGNTHCRLRDSFAMEMKELLTQIPNLKKIRHQDFPEFKEAVTTLLATQDECETLKKEICEILECLDKERSKCHEMKEKHKTRLLRAKQKLDDETAWRDDKISNLERELSLCSHSLAKEKEVTISITVENDKLLIERRRLLQQLNEEEHNKKDCNLTASLSKCRVDFLEIENKKLGNKILHMSNQLTVLERSLQKVQSLHLNEELKKTSNPMQVLKSLRLQIPSVMMPESSEIQDLFKNAQNKQPEDVTSFLSGSLSRSSEMGYLNLTSAQSLSDHSAPLAGFGSSDRTCS
ncbi:coiled-coil domain-containing protein 30 isoform X2 [Notolabrus celidotus]|uniref:coiled-coil domain-containing protein 30 isoform X2 n=1 Tax=Notolabrus celidotus TaxID=1203425 RepID=UPI00148F92EC|nr:coiled-coil domain-containing protein 30 isoform X2 [Notolabrus celidotus]